jgi:hypothetical protein
MAEQDQDQNEKLMRMVESFIQLANEHSRQMSPGSVSSALLYAASRFNAYIVASHAENFDQEKESSIRYFLDQYEKMLRDNMDDYQQNPISSAEEKHQGASD